MGRVLDRRFSARSFVMAALAAVTLAYGAAPAFADEWREHERREYRDRDWHRDEWRERRERDWREHERWEHRGPFAYYGSPSYVYPPPIVYGPPPLNFGFYFR